MISAKVICDSLSPQGHRITTFELVFPRFILAELNTHRMFSKNSASSRAIPFSKMVKAVQENPFIPMAWQKQHSGMQGTEYITDEKDLKFCNKAWLMARDAAIVHATGMNEELEITKQLCNRLLEPFMYHKVLLTATEFDNFFELRCPQYTVNVEGTSRVFKSKKDLIKVFGKQEDMTDEYFRNINKGQSEIHMMQLAECMYDALNESTPKQLKAGEWHIPGINIIED
jgi:hypothetical protein